VTPTIGGNGRRGLDGAAGASARPGSANLPGRVADTCRDTRVQHNPGRNRGLVLSAPGRQEIAEHPVVQLVPFGEPGASEAPFWLSGKFAFGPVCTVWVFGHSENAMTAKNIRATAPTTAMIGLVTSVL